MGEQVLITTQIDNINEKIVSGMRNITLSELLRFPKFRFGGVPFMESEIAEDGGMEQVLSFSGSSKC